MKKLFFLFLLCANSLFAQISKPVIISTNTVSGANCHIEIFIDPLTAYGYCQLYVNGNPVTKVLSGLDMLPAFFNTPTAINMLPGTVIDVNPAGKSFTSFWRNWKMNANHITPVEHVDYEQSNTVTVSVPVGFTCGSPAPTTTTKKKK